MNVGPVLFDLQRAAAGTNIMGIAFSAHLRHILLIPQPQAQRMVPDFFPFIGQDIADRFIPGLAGKYIPVRLNTHAVLCGRAGFISHTGFHRLKQTVLCGCIPQQAGI